MGLKAFGANIIGLSDKVHLFHYDFGDEFFEAYGTGLISQGQFSADVALDKHDTFIEAVFKIKGQTRVICDRSLDPFDYAVKFERKILFKYGDRDEELSDEIIMIQRDTDTLELGQYIYEFIGLAIPIKKLHPRYKDEEADNVESTGKIIYSSEDSSKDNNDESIDPRWEILKKLK